MPNKKTDLPKYRALVSLIPGGTTQFLDLGFDITKIKRLSTEFFEYEKESVGDKKNLWSLKCLEKDSDQDFYIDKQTRELVKDPKTNMPNKGITPTYSLSVDKALEPYIDQWVPVPFLRSESNIGSFDMRYRSGPTDWSRVRVSELDQPDSAGNTHRITIAFDTFIQAGIDISKVLPEEGYPALSEADMRDGAEFHFVSDVKHYSWFLGLEWINDWLQEFFNQMMQKKRPGKILKDADFEYHTEHLARYIAFLEVLASTNEIPKIRLIDPERHKPIDVDLVLDIGNSRTIGMLIERKDGESVSLSNSAVLELRDLSDPRLMHRDTFNSFVCFAKARFGDLNGYSRGAGRIKRSFSWPSVVRVGQEANRLALKSRREEGQTSMSSPKRYLWDLRPRSQEWRYCPETESAFSEEPPVNSGDFVGFINNEGTPLHAFKDSRYQNLEFLAGQSFYPVTEPKFSRSSMMMFLLSEILAHTLVQINSPAERGNRQQSDIPRRLRRIILTVPPAMSVSERKIFKRWANWAVDVLWQALEWDEFSGRISDFRQKPEVKINLDEASTTQLVFVYNEIQEKFSGDAAEYFKTFGKVRPNRAAGHSLRVASIDIGGGTTDMIVTTYLNQSEGATSTIVPKQEFREGFNIAGDDLLKAVIESHVIPSLENSLNQAGLRQAKEILKRKLGKDAVGTSESEKNLRAQFAQQVLTPFGLQILSLSEKISLPDAQNSVMKISWEDVFTDQNHPRPAVIEFIDELIESEDDAKFSLLNWSCEVDMSAVIITISSTIGPYLNDFSEVIRLWDCDYLVLSGRPSCLPAVQAAIYKTPPVQPSRIIAMSEYEIEPWYPFWSPDGKVDDPKTTGVVGAVLCAISEGNVMNFHFRTKDLRPASTIKFIGQMSKDHQIKNQNLFFNQIDLDTAKEEDMQGSFKFTAPLYIGFRQLKTERWKATPFYFVSFANQEAIDRSLRNDLPYEIKFSYRRRFDDDVEEGDRGENEGYLKVEEIISANGNSVPRSDIDFQLKSLWEDQGHWLDTGLFEIR
ncbi:MAG: virulence factor SrfB [Betaproteobacteria bacterium]